jgi:hypothetical protein
MKVLFTNNISEVYVHEKTGVWDIELSVKNGKRKVGTVLGIFPKYERCYGVYHWWDNEYWGTIEEYNKKSTDKYIEGEGFYYKPHCIIVSNSGEKNKVIFETVEELLSYVEDLKKIGDHIIMK